MRLARIIIALLLAIGLLASSDARAQVSVGVSITVAPPPLPVYAQPVIPAPGYIWVPGYWAWGPGGYYWVPGTWVLPPAVGLLWTPGYWAWRHGVFVWSAGYWGPHIGFYGGVNYGFGYVGVGYAGGFWERGAFHYNTAANNIRNVNVTNTYNKTVTVNNTTINNISYNGGNGGTTAQPTPQELAAAHERHTPPTALQTRHEHIASNNHALLASVNHGHPAMAATATAAKFGGPKGGGNPHPMTKVAAEPKAHVKRPPPPHHEKEKGEHHP